MAPDHRIKLSVVLGPLAKPRVDTAADPDGQAPSGLVCVDERSHGQRMHDALEDVCDRMLRSDALPDSGGTPATVIVTITADDLLARSGAGRTSDGAVLSMAQMLDLAAQADIIPAVLNRSGAVLSVAGLVVSPRQPRPGRWWPGTEDAASPVVIGLPSCATATMSWPGSTEV